MMANVWFSISGVVFGIGIAIIFNRIFGSFGLIFTLASGAFIGYIIGRFD